MTGTHVSCRSRRYVRYRTYRPGKQAEAVGTGEPQAPRHPLSLRHPPTMPLTWLHPQESPRHCHSPLITQSPLSTIYLQTVPEKGKP